MSSDLGRLEAVVSRIEVALHTLDQQGGSAVARIEQALQGLDLGCDLPSSLPSLP
jgi:hypothetical protein